MAAPRGSRWALALGVPVLAAAYGCALVAGITAPLPLHCTNGQQDEGEKGVDCGGACARCPGQSCTNPDQCASELCSKAGTCTTAADTEVCPLGQRAINCQFCRACAVDAPCVFDHDCTSGLCLHGTCTTCSAAEGFGCTGVDGGPSGACTPVMMVGGSVGVCLGVTCSNGVMDNDETGVDCGGSCSKACSTDAGVP